MQKGIQIGKPAPQFKAQAWVYKQDDFKEISLNDFKGKYLILFFYPLDFTFVCPTEIIEFSKYAAEFRKIGCEVVGCSVDSQYVHMEWTMKPRNKGGLGEIDIPLLSDLNKQISKDYGCLDENFGAAFRATYIIDKNQVLRHISQNDLGVGRNIAEYLRLVQAFQFVDEHGEVCPASWRPGEKAMDTNIKSEKLQNYWQEVHAKK